MSATPSGHQRDPDDPAEPRRRDWVIEGGGDAGGIATFLNALRTGRWLILVALVACLAAALIYLARATKVYEAQADILISPQSSLSVPVSGVITQSSDPTRDVETVARLVTSPGVTRLVKGDLDLDGTLRSIAAKVDVTPLASANIITITAKAGTARAAQALADAFGEQFVAYRNARLRDSLTPQIKQLRDQVGTNPSASELRDPESPARQLQTLETLSRGGDPSVTLEARAELPASPASPRPLLTVGAAIVAGLVLGLVGAFGMQLLDPRLRREDQLRAVFRLPILARVPLERRRRNRPLLPSELSLGALDAYQALRAALSTSRDNPIQGRTVLVTGPSPGDGKTTAAINLASGLAAAGRRVILIEADSRRPSIGRALDMSAEVGLASVITGRRYMVDALLPVGEEDSKLKVLLTSSDEAPAADVLSRVSVDTLLLQAQRLADWVIVDSPPLNHVAETLAIAQAVDEVLIVLRIGKTNQRDLMDLAEMLDQQDIEPSGFVVLGGHVRQGYY